MKKKRSSGFFLITFILTKLTWKLYHTTLFCWTPKYNVRIWYDYYWREDFYPTPPYKYKSALDLLKIYEKIEPKHEHNSAWPDVPPHTTGGNNNKYIHTTRSIFWPKNASKKYAKYAPSTRAIWTKDKNEYVKVKSANGFE